MSIFRATVLGALLCVTAMSEASDCTQLDCSCKITIAGWETTNLVCKFPCELAKATCKTVEKVPQEIGNGLEDLRKLVETGKCGGDICDVLEATKNFGVDQIKDTASSLERAGERLREGKPLDALWHLHMDYLNNSQSNAAEATRRSSLLFSTGAIAAGAYGGPAGAAGYSAWTTYNSTKDLGLALKTGLITGASAWAAAAVNAGPAEAAKGLAPGVPAAQVTAPEVASRIVMGGVIAGTAVAAAGGSKEEVENAITAGAVSVVVREGYRSLTSHELNNRSLRTSVGAAYCLKADPNNRDNAGLSCLPPKEAYIREKNRSISYERTKSGQPTTVPKINFDKLDQYRPHLGTFAEAFKSQNEGGPPPALINPSESSTFMTFLSRLSGGNAMSVAHDKFVTVTNPGMGTYIDLGYSVGTIAPFVVLTYVGAGGEVKKMIQDVATKKPDSVPVVADQKTVPTAAGLAVATGATSTAAHGAQADTGLTEMTHVVCRKDSTERQYLLKVALTPDGTVDALGRVCRIDEGVEDAVRGRWHAHSDRRSCAARLGAMLKLRLKQQYQCAASSGIHQAGIKLAGK